MIKKMVLCVLTIVVLNTFTYSQDIFVNRVFQSATGSPLFNPILNPLGVQWSSSIRSTSGGIIMVGYTAITGQGQNIYIIKYAATGSIVFQQNWNTSGTNNDYGVGVYEASNGDVYVCGTTDNGGSTNYDLVVLRYNSGGTLLNWDVQDGPANLNDVGVSIAKDPSGNVIVSANTEDTNGFSDFWLLKFDAALNLMNTNTYDYTGLHDYALGLSFNTSGNICLIGPSASGLTACDYVMVVFNGSSLAYMSETRNNIPGTALDQALAFCKDANNNTYITGKAWNGTDFDIKTIRINANFSMGWTATLNPYGLDDAGSSITTDGSGNVIVGGYVTKSNNVKDLVCIKYNPSNGNTIWQYNQSSKNASGDAAIKQVCTNPANDNVYFVAVEEGLSGYKQTLTSRLSSAGVVRWQRNVEDVSDDILPSDIKYATDGIYVISVLDSVTDHYLTTKYSDLELDTARKFVGNIPCWKNRELIVSFKPGAINTTAIDNEFMKFSDLSDFITSTAFSTLNGAIDGICPHCDIKAVKVYDGVKTTDAVGISRLGTNVPNPSFWSTLLLQFPAGVNIQQAQTILNSLGTIVAATQVNNFMETTAVPNDSLYATQQAALHAISPNTNAHINVEEAWDVAQDCGASFVKGGVFDTGVEYKHRDFGYVAPAFGTFTPLNFGKVEGYHFGSGFGQAGVMGGVDLRTQNFGILCDPMGHGTSVAGIIGAQRNNTSGIAGIAGGNAANSNSGVRLYSLNTQFTSMANLLNAMRATSKADGSTPFSYGLHFSNHSYKMIPGWWPVDSFPLLRDVVHYANRMQVTFVAARGNNDGFNNNDAVVPGNYDSSWVVCVGGSGVNGLRWSGSYYGKSMDVIAPADSLVVIKTTMNDFSYTNFSGTSAAAPHASGVVALLMSYMNDSTASYNNLAPEDCDFIIQRSATDVGPAGYDSLNGYGRLNAGKALRMVEKPFRHLYHFGTNLLTSYTLNKSVYNNVDTVRLTEAYQNYEVPRVVYPAGKYIVKTFQINATVSHNGAFSTDSLMYYWARPSSSYVYDLPNAQKRMDMHERVRINSCNGSNASLTGYVYQVKDSLGSSIGWWPCDTSFSALYSGVDKPKTLMEYSFLSKNKAVGIHERAKDSQSISVFPNPASHQQTLVIESDKMSSCKVELYDLMGRFIKVVYAGKANIGKTSIIHQLDGLPSSMYIYIIKLDDNTLSEKFIKE